MEFEPSNLTVAILAGGLATRLKPLTLKVPKSLVPVAGKPFLTHQLELLKNNGIQRVVLCLGHLGEMIEKEFGNGETLGIKIDYSFDGSVLLGTGGAIRKALPKLGNNFFVLYGDSYLTASFAPIVDFFKHSGKKGLMTVYRNVDCYDNSNAVFCNGNIVTYDKVKHTPEMQHIDYGLNLFRSSVFEQWPPGVPFDLSEVTQKLIAQDDLAGFEVQERFYEIGSPNGLAELNLIKNK